MRRPEARADDPRAAVGDRVPEPGTGASPETNESLATPGAAFENCFRPRVFRPSQALLAGWIVCSVPRTLSEVWPAPGPSR